MNFLFEIDRKERNISELAKRGDLTVSVASTLISRWARAGVLLKEKSESGRGNEIIIKMTEYGESQVKLLREISKNYQKRRKKAIEEECGKNGIPLETKSEEVKHE